MNGDRHLPAPSFLGMLVRSALFALVVGLLAVSCVPRPPAAAKQIQAPRLVATGTIKGDMKARENVVNGLRILKVASGQMVITFDGYRMPDKHGQPQYLVEVEACRIGGMVVPAATVESYGADGIVLRVTDPGGRMPLPLKYLIEHEFTIEVYENRPR